MITIIDSNIPEYCARNAQQWDELFDEYGLEPSESLEWTVSLLNNHITDADEVRLVEIREDDELISIIPLVYRQRRVFGFKITHVFPVSELYNTHSGFLARSITPDLMGRIIASLSKNNHRWNIFTLSRIIENSDLHASITVGTRILGLKSSEKYTLPSFYINLPETMDQYLNERSSKFRNFLKRTENKLRRLGEIKIVFNEDENGFNELYAQLISIEKCSWKHNHGTAISSIARQEKFYREMCHSSAKKHKLNVAILYVGNKPIAYNMGYIHKNVYSYLKTSFDETYRKYSPATLLRKQQIEYLIAHKIKLMDFPGEPYAWETQWTRELNWHCAHTIFNSCFTSMLLYLLYKSKNIVKRNRRKRLDFVDPKSLTA